jgi:hypothetical protein
MAEIDILSRTKRKKNYLPFWKAKENFQKWKTCENRLKINTIENKIKLTDYNFPKVQLTDT